MRYYRIKQLSENEFSAQIQLGFIDWFLDRWGYIVRWKYLTPDLVYYPTYFDTNHIFKTLDEALEACKYYEEFLQEQEKQKKEAKQYPKIIKVDL